MVLGLSQRTVQSNLLSIDGLHLAAATRTVVLNCVPGAGTRARFVMQYKGTPACVHEVYETSRQPKASGA